MKRERPPIKEGDRHAVGWVGPIRSARQAERERKAWAEAAWVATVHPTSPAVRAEVRAWEKAKRAVLDRPRPRRRAAA